MQSERSQILALFAARRIDMTEAERLLILVSGRDRFLTLALCAVFAVAASSANLSQYRLGESFLSLLHSVLPSVTGSEAFHHLHLFFIRLLGELP
jgi:hypothetical protein